MPFWRLFTLLATVLAFFNGYPCYAQKTTVDPNVGQAPKLSEDDIADGRLAQKVTYEAWHMPLKTILGELSEETGVTLNAGYSKNDWQVRDRRMNVYVKDVTLAQLMNSIARVMKFKWSKNDDLDPPTYRLYADRKLLGQLQAEATRLEAELKKEEIRRRKLTVEALADVADLSGNELENLREENPYLYVCASTGFAKAMTQMFADEPNLREAFIKGNKTAAIDANMLPPFTQQLCSEAARGCWPLDHVTQNRPPLSDSFEEVFPNSQLFLTWMSSPSEYTQRKKLFYFGNVCGSAESGCFLGDFRYPYAEASKAWGNACLDAMEGKLPVGRRWSTVAPHYFPTEDEEANEIEPYFMYDPVVDHPDDPDLHKEITLTGSEEDYKAFKEQDKAAGGRTHMRLFYQLLLEAIADAAGMSVVSDSYNVLLPGRLSLSGKRELVTILDEFAEAQKCNWEKHGSILEFRRRDWFRRRASQIPDEWLKPWRDEIERNGILSLDSYARMVALTQEQIEENITSDPLLDQCIGDYRRVKGFCSFYAQLSDSQHKLILSETGLDVRLLSPAQWQLYSDMYEYGLQPRWHTEEFSNPGRATVIIKGARKPREDGGVTYRFTAYLTKEDGSTDEQGWQINLRKIVKPKDPASRAASGK